MLVRLIWWTPILSTYVFPGGHLHNLADDRSAGSGESGAMSELLDIIDEYKDAHGAPSDASIARAIGVAPQTLSSWRKRGIRELPDRDTLRSIARLTRRDYTGDVLPAALRDIDYLEDTDPPITTPPVPRAGETG